MKENKDKVSEDVAISEVKAFVKYFTRKDKTEEFIKDEYPDIIDAVKKGLLVFDADMVPTFTLEFPVLNDQNEPSITTITFKTRIKPGDQRTIAKGIEAKDTLGFTFKSCAFLISQPVAMLDKFERFDWKVIEQISTVFM